MMSLEISTFIGRFHPVLVHLPIGFLILAILLEWFAAHTKKEVKNGLISTAWFFGAISAIGAVISGWQLGSTGLYIEDQLFVHRWLGVAIAIVAIAGYWLKRKSDRQPKWMLHSINLLVLGMLLVEGHKGGNLTHGETYLTDYAPKLIKSVVAHGKKQDSIGQFTNLDSVLIYHDLVYPIFRLKCVPCHNNKIKQGGLNMSHPDSLQLGASGDPVILAGDAGQSEVFKRITLPQSDVKFMPPSPNPLTYDEIKLIEWWIVQGAPFEGHLSSVTIPEDIKSLFLRRHGLDTSPRPWYETVQLAPLDSLKIIDLRKLGFTVKTLGAKNNLLDVEFRTKQLSDKKLEQLAKAQTHITWLSLAETNISDKGLFHISQFPNLTRLQLEKTAITDEGISILSNLPHLESLNIYATNVTERCLIDILKMKSLKRVYVWQTNISQEEIDAVQNQNPQIEFITGQ